MQRQKEPIWQQLKERILILDGAMGTMIQQHHFSEADFRGSQFAQWHVAVQGHNDLLSITQPEAIRSIHEAYFGAGADIATTNTFSSNAIALADYEMQDLVYDLNVAAARLAREAADYYTAKMPEKRRFVAGGMGPTNKTASLSPDVNRPGFRAITFQELATAYADQAKALIAGGVDLLLLETVFDTLNVKAALFALENVFQDIGYRLPVMVSGTITDASGRTLSGQNVEAFYISIAHAPLLSVGLNCALGADQLTPYLERLALIADEAISAHPNAGLPNAFGEYDQSPEQMTEQIRLYLDKNLVNIVGGCCGTTPEHIRQIASLCATAKPRPLKEEAYG